MLYIKKYSNRKLYDTTRSRYISLGDVKTLIDDKVSFEVYDNKTGRNVTNTVLKQLIASIPLAIDNETLTTVIGNAAPIYWKEIKWEI